MLLLFISFIIGYFYIDFLCLYEYNDSILFHCTLLLELHVGLYTDLNSYLFHSKKEQLSQNPISPRIMKVF